MTRGRFVQDSKPSVRVRAGIAVLLWTAAGATSGAAPPSPSPVWVDAGFRLDRWPSPTAASDEDDSDRLSLLVRVETAESEATGSSGPRAGVKTLAERVGGRVAFEYRALPDTINVRGFPSDKLGELQSLEGVKSVVRDYRLHGLLHQSVPHIGGLQGQLASAGLPFDGTGVRICVIDTGIDTDHLLFTGRLDLAAAADFTSDMDDVEDAAGHGSHVAGIAAGNDGGTLDFGCGPLPLQGVAPEATIIPVKALGLDNSGLASDIIAAIDHCVSPSLPGGPADVINLSLGGGAFAGACDADPVAAAANAAATDAVVVAAAGNDARVGTLPTPACGSEVLAVGATYDDAFPNCEFSSSTITLCIEQSGSECLATCSDVTPVADRIACFSNQAPQIDVVAPGCFVHSAFILPGGVSVISACGTSMAAPHVAGLAALMLHAEPTATPAQIRAAVRNGAIDLGAHGQDSTYGHGRVDAIRSLELIRTPCTPDGDGDGQRACEGDCDDGDPERFRFATEVCDTVDNDCDDVVDEGFDPDGDLLGTCVDNCPETSNPPQTDFDGDGRGDACESGPDLADIDRSSRIDGFDLGRLGRAFGATCVDSRYDVEADLDRDAGVCMIDGDDLALFAPHFGVEVDSP